MYSPSGEDSSTASRSVLLGGAAHQGQSPLWVPWAGGWGALAPPVSQPNNSSQPQDGSAGGTIIEGQR